MLGTQLLLDKEASSAIALLNVTHSSGEDSVC